jgi:hypothetical protein
MMMNTLALTLTATVARETCIEVMFMHTRGAEKGKCSCSRHADFLNHDCTVRTQHENMNIPEFGLLRHGEDMRPFGYLFMVFVE